MRNLHTAPLAVLLIAALSVLAPRTTQGQSGYGDILRLDPALDRLISPDARLTLLKSGLGFSEGPVWVSAGYLLFSDIAANVIYKWTPADHELTVFLKNSGYNGDLGSIARQGYIATSGPLYVYDFGSNGTTLDRQGRLVWCAQGDRAIIRLEQDGRRTVLANRYQGRRFSRPNDIVVKSDGAVYFTDDHTDNPTTELPYSGLYSVKDGAVKLLVKDLTAPNGLAFSPDERYLYLIDSRTKHIFRYEVRPDDTLANRQVFIDMSANHAPGVPDGMRVDRQGNVYSTGPGGIWVMTPEGKHIGTILLPEPATNLAFGDADYQTLYITDHRSLMKIRLNAPGIAPGPPQP